MSWIRRCVPLVLTILGVLPIAFGIAAIWMAQMSPLVHDEFWDWTDLGWLGCVSTFLGSAVLLRVRWIAVAFPAIFFCFAMGLACLTFSTSPVAAAFCAVMGVLPMAAQFATWREFKRRKCNAPDQALQ